MGLAWDSTFVDSALEDEYYQLVLKPRLASSVLQASVPGAVLSFLVSVQSRLSFMLFTPTTLAFLSVSVVAFGMESGLFAVCSTETLSVLFDVVLSVATATGPFQYKPESFLSLPPKTGAANDDHYLILACSLITTSLYSSLSVRRYILYAAMMLGAGVGVELFLGDIELQSTLAILFAAVCAINGRAKHQARSRREFFLVLQAKQATTVRHEAERLLLAEAERVKAARGRVLRMVMHDIRSPLLSISSATSLLKSAHGAGEGLGEVGAEALLAIEVSAVLCLSIVSDALDLERIDSGCLQVIDAQFEPAHLLEAVRATYRQVAAQHGVVLEIAPIPPELIRRLFIGDQKRLQQVLNNGLSNAIKSALLPSVPELLADEFTGSGGRVIVSLSSCESCSSGGTLLLQPPPPQQADRVEPPFAFAITVRDSGSGLSQDDLELLDRNEGFTQVGTGRDQGPGASGLGLSISRQLLQLHHNSELNLSSHGSGLGTTFTMRVRFPAGFRVLHVEDDLIVHRMMTLAVFSPLAVETVHVTNGVAALALVLGADGQKGQRFDVIVIDNQMPLMNGAEATRALREGGCTSFMIGMTGDPEHCVERDEFLAAGLDICVDKDGSGTAAVVQALRKYATHVE